MNLFPWLTDEVLHADLVGAIVGHKLNQDSAVKVINQLTKFGNILLQRIIGGAIYTKFFPTDRHGGPWTTGQPVGWVDHYTAAPDAKGSLLWFSNMSRGTDPSTSSAHYVIDRDGSIITVVDPLSTIAWHARAANPTHIGIEHVCTGLLGKSPSGYTYLGNIPYPKTREPDIQIVNGEAWEPFTVQQVLSNLALKRLLIAAIPTLSIEFFTDHQALNPQTKRDCGPLWPLKALNKFAFSFVGLVEELPWMEEGLLTKDRVSEFEDAVALVVP